MGGRKVFCGLFWEFSYYFFYERMYFKYIWFLNEFLKNRFLKDGVICMLFLNLFVSFFDIKLFYVCFFR